MLTFIIILNAPIINIIKLHRELYAIKLIKNNGTNFIKLCFFYRVLTLACVGYQSKSQRITATFWYALGIVLFL